MLPECIFHVCNVKLEPCTCCFTIALSNPLPPSLRKSHQFFLAGPPNTQQYCPSYTFLRCSDPIPFETVGSATRGRSGTRTRCGRFNEVLLCKFVYGINVFLNVFNRVFPTNFPQRIFAVGWIRRDISWGGKSSEEPFEAFEIVLV